MVIVEPRNIRQDQINKLKRNGSKIYGYTSVIEQNENNASFENIDESCFYKVDGKKQKNEKWNSYYMDIRESKYTDFLKLEIENEIVKKGLDGIFFDTVGDIDDSSWNEYDKIVMRRSYTDFIKNIRHKYKSIYIIQNWGLYTAYNNSSKFIDGIMWESFSYNLLDNDQWSKDRYNEIEEMDVDFYLVMRKKEDIKVLKNKEVYVFLHGSDIYNEF